jgi:transcriptional regulator with XRE-family HTH domain
MANNQQDRAFFEALGRRIAELRKAQGLTQAELARNLGIAQQTLNCYESGTRRMPLSTVPALAKELAVPPESLLGEEFASAKRGPAPKFQQQLERLGRLPRTKQRVVSEMLDAYLKQAS